MINFVLGLLLLLLNGLTLIANSAREQPIKNPSTNKNVPCLPVIEALQEQLYDEEPNCIQNFYLTNSILLRLSRYEIFTSEEQPREEKKPEGRSNIGLMKKREIH